MQVPQTMTNLSRLTFLSLGGSSLDSFPTVLCDMHHLIELDLGNSIQDSGELPAEIGNLRSLQVRPWPFNFFVVLRVIFVVMF